MNYRRMYRQLTHEGGFLHSFKAVYYCEKYDHWKTKRARGTLAEIRFWRLKHGELI